MAVFVACTHNTDPQSSTGRADAGARGDCPPNAACDSFPFGGTSGGTSGSALPSDGEGGSSGGVCGVATSDVPGTPLYARDMLGAGPCATVSLGDIIDAARALDPSTPDVSAPVDPSTDPTVGEAPQVFAWTAAHGGFALAFVRGSGDCQAGCIDHEYWYFETNPTSPSCTLISAGKHTRTFNSAGNCYDTAGSARWGQPTPLAASSRCKPDGRNGTTTVCGSGPFTPCGGNTGVYDGIVTITVAENVTDPTQGSVTLNGTRYPGVDGVPFAVKIEGSMISGSESGTDAGPCGDKRELQFKYDRDSPQGVAGYIHVAETKCADAGAGSCQGEIAISFSADTNAR